MKKIIMLVCTLALFLPIKAGAVEFERINTDPIFLDSLNRDVTGDIEYLRGLANAYKDRYIVTESEYAEVTAIDKFYNRLLSPLTLEELDTGKKTFDITILGSDERRRHYMLLNMLGGLSGYKAEFIPVASFRIYRNIELVGGYVRYTSSHKEADESYWQCVCTIEGMTREVVPYSMRIKMLEKVRYMDELNRYDNHFKIFLLRDGEIDSLWER